MQSSIYLKQTKHQITKHTRITSALQEDVTNDGEYLNPEKNVGRTLTNLLIMRTQFRLIVNHLNLY